jgi:hypothetical protein
MAESKVLRLHARPVGYISGVVSALESIAGHAPAVQVFKLAVSSDDPDFNGLHAINYVQADEVRETGSYCGYATWPLPNGDSVYVQFDGVSRRRTTDGEGWEAPYDGRFEFVRGTGKYANIHGNGIYAGGSTEDGPFWVAVVEIQY